MHSAAVFHDELFHVVVAHRKLVNAGTIDMAGHGPEFCAATLFGAQILIRLAAHLDDVRHGGERFDVVDDRRAGIETGDGREGRFHSRMAAHAFERTEQRSLFTANVCARTGMGVNLAGEVRVENILAQQSGGAGFGKRPIHDVDQVFVFAARIDVVRLRAERVGGDDHAFDQHVRIALHQVAIFESAGFGFVGVADYVLRLRRILGNESPLHPGRKTRAAATAQADFLTSLMTSSGDIEVKTFLSAW